MFEDTILADLNPPQQLAVTTRDGPVMVLAGAGSGKTRVLTRRLAWLLASGAARPGEVLAVTFTNKAAREMRERVAEMLMADVRGLWIGTFHGMGARMLRHNAEVMGYGSDFTILDTGDQERLVKRLLADLTFEDTYWTPKRLINAFSRWKDDGLAPEQIGEGQVRLPRTRERVVALYRAYQEALRKSNCMDFGDLLLNCLDLWQRAPQVLEGYQQRFRYILVDEYQDTNAVQYRWLQQLAAGHGNLCVVGDDDQSIYSWRGARLDNILRFQDDFPGVRIVRLEQNYRSSGNILEAAGHLINHNRGRMGKTLWTEDQAGHKVELYTAEDGEDEARFVAREILRQCGDGRFDRVAVLVRASRQTRTIEEGLMAEGIPYQVVGGMRFLDRAEIRDAVAYLRLAYSARDDLAFERIINVPKRGLGAAAIDTIRATAATQGVGLLDACRLLATGEVDGGLRPAARNRLKEFVALMEEAAVRVADNSPEGLLVFLLEQSGYNAYLKKEERGEDRLENLQELRNALTDYDDLTRFLEDAALVTDMMDQEEARAPNRVTISTLHAAKGLEFPTVFLVGMEEGLLPHKLVMDEVGSEGLEEERRLTYVGMTRAREKLYLSHARRRRMYNRYEAALPSRFLAELPEHVLHHRNPRVSARRGVHVDSRMPRRGWPVRR